MQKLTTSLTSFFEIMQKHCKLVILGNLFLLGYTHVKWYQQGKINIILHVLLEILQRYYKLVILGSLGMPSHSHVRWYWQTKINFIHHVFLEILQSIMDLLFWVIWTCLAIIIIIIIIIITTTTTITLFQVDEMKIQNVIQVTYTR